MYNKGDLIIYGSKGVCQVADITLRESIGSDSMREFYVLLPLNTPGSTVYSPVDNTTTITRYLIKPEEAKKLLNELPELEEVEVPSEKQREQTYKEYVRSCSCRDCARLIKTLYHRKRARLASGKKVTATDDRYLKLAEEALYSELSHQLHMDRSELPALFVSHLGTSIG